MANVAKFERPYQFEVNPHLRKKHPMRLSALLALKQALLDGKYEECRDIVSIAKEFGASDQEIYFLLEDPRRKP